jgi:dipeptidyl aminopeptidase/acylaminoacyl peptidase
VTTPYGAWPSPITAAALVQSTPAVADVAVDGGEVWWSESRPAEGGRVVLVRRDPGGSTIDALPAGFNARTRVHEYGGGAWCVAGGVAWFANWDDQRVHRLDPGADPRPITPEPAVRHGLRYADLVVSGDGAELLCVRERHEGDAEARNEIVAVPADGEGDVRVLVSGPDFVSSPRRAADGRLAWVQWNHPDMPWDATELRVDGEVVAGGPGESVIQPEWGPDGRLYYLSDRSGWWNLYRDDDPLAPMEAEIGGPQWVFGSRWYAVLDDGRIVASVTRDGLDHLGVIEPGAGRVELLDTSFTSIGQLVADGEADGDGVVAVAAGPATRPEPVRVGLDGTVEVLRRSSPLDFDEAWFARPEPIDFPSGDGRPAHALLYRPVNPDVEPPDGERPPLLVLSHGGPTSAARPMLQLAVQFWTSRGFAVVDVNYGGSTGYGRAYRERLRGRWGIVDVEDCIAAARWCAEAGVVDPGRLAIRGGSAGGYTTLAALAFHDVFAAGASHYGVADLAALARDTHKFESRYLDGLVGPWPEAEDVYRARSPIHHTDGLSCPLIIFQGLEDEVVPPDQAEMMVDALRRKGLPFAYLAFEGEQHGFRRAENIVRALEAELWFYGRVFGFEPADEIEPVPAENL